MTARKECCSSVHSQCFGLAWSKALSVTASSLQHQEEASYYTTSKYFSYVIIGLHHYSTYWGFTFCIRNGAQLFWENGGVKWPLRTYDYHCMMKEACWYPPGCSDKLVETRITTSYRDAHIQNEYNPLRWSPSIRAYWVLPQQIAFEIFLESLSTLPTIAFPMFLMEFFEGIMESLDPGKSHCSVYTSHCHPTLALTIRKPAYISKRYEKCLWKAFVVENLGKKMILFHFQESERSTFCLHNDAHISWK